MPTCSIMATAAAWSRLAMMASRTRGLASSAMRAGDCATAEQHALGGRLVQAGQVARQARRAAARPDCARASTSAPPSSSNSVSRAAGCSAASRVDRQPVLQAEQALQAGLGERYPAWPAGESRTRPPWAGCRRPPPTTCSAVSSERASRAISSAAGGRADDRAIAGCRRRAAGSRRSRPRSPAPGRRPRRAAAGRPA